MTSVPAEEEKTEGGEAARTRRSVVVGSYGGSKYMRVEQSAVKSLGKGDVEIKIEACGVNFQDIMLRQGFIEQLVKPPFTMGTECAGVITAIGEEVKKHKIGDCVVALVEYGAWTDCLVVHVESDTASECQPAVLLPWPAELSAGQASISAYAYLTAFYILRQVAQVQPGDVVLIHCAGGGVGSAVGQLARTIKDVKMIGTASKDKHEKIAPLFTTLFTPDQDCVAEIKKLHPEGIDVILDCLGGDEVAKSECLLKPLGKYVLYGMSNLVTGDRKSILNLAKHWLHVERINPLRLRDENRSFAGFSLKPLIFPVGTGTANRPHSRHSVESIWAELVKLIESKQIDPWVDSEWGFHEVKEAMLRLQERKNVGKVFLNPNKSPPEQQKPDDVVNKPEEDEAKS